MNGTKAQRRNGTEERGGEREMGRGGEFITPCKPWLKFGET